MAYELKQELRLTQSLVMTPQLQLAIKLLQLSMLDLVEMVREEIQVNPVLEETPGDVPEDAPSLKKIEPERREAEPDWEAYIESQGAMPRPRLDFSARGDEEDGGVFANIAASGGGLREHLLWQLNMLGLPYEEAKLSEFIIGNVDEGGYLRLGERDGRPDADYEASVIDEIVRHTGSTRSAAEGALARIQRFDPAGVCSRTFRECLLIQARLLPVRDTVVEEIIENHLGLVGVKNYKAVARALCIPVESVYEAVKTINKSLNPTPGAGFGGETPRAVLPDAFINKVGDDYVITLNEDGLPKLKISGYYKELLKANGKSDPEAKTYLQDKLRSAFWLIKSVHQRQRTIYRVVESIARFQRDFLDNGLRYLKPLVLKDVASELGIHESTVSRVTSNKYVQTPRGIFELKYFFSNGMASDSGADVTAEYIKEKVREIIGGEDPMHPLSDQEIVERLKTSGINLARRTATKYREALGLLSSSRRRTHF